MASNIDVYFIKKKNFSKSVLETQDFGFLAKETSRGYIQLAVNYEHLAPVKSEAEWERHESTLRNFIFSNQIKSEHVYHFKEYMENGEDGVCLTLYDHDGFKIHFENDYFKKERAFDEKMLELFGVENAYNDIGFSRQNRDLISDKQKDIELKRIEAVFESLYQKWKERFELLTTAQQFKQLLLIENKNSISYNDDFQIEKKHICRFFKIDLEN